MNRSLGKYCTLSLYFCWEACQNSDKLNRLASSWLERKIPDQKDLSSIPSVDGLGVLTEGRLIHGIRSLHSVDPDVSCSVLAVDRLLLFNASSLARHWNTHLPDAVPKQYWGTYVEKPAETKTDNQLASSLVIAQHFWSGEHEFESPWLVVLPEGGKVLGIRSFHTRFIFQLLFVIFSVASPSHCIL